jgi:hypothetical protein
VKKLSYLAAIVILSITAAALYYLNAPKALESITFFPIDPNVTYKAAETSLTQTGQQPVLWKISSTLDRKAYLRQDAGFLFVNGRLRDKLGKWQQNTESLTQEKRISGPQTGYFQAITFHHAELHEKGGQIFSSQAMSEDYLYLITGTQQQIHSFKTPKTPEEKRWQETLAEQTERLLQYSWNKGVRHFSIPLQEYQAFPLSEFNNRAKDHLPGFTKNETAGIVGRLWEGLYKNYFLGIKKQDGTIVNPIGSTTPLILLAKNKTHLLVLTETASGEPIVLRQVIEASF